MRVRSAIAAVPAAILVCVSPSLHAEPSRQEIDAFITADENGDKHLSRTEFRVFVKLMADAGNPKARRIRFFRAYGYAFGIADADANGLIAPAEMIKADAEN